MILKAGKKSGADGGKKKENQEKNGWKKDGTIKITRLCIEEAASGPVYLL